MNNESGVTDWNKKRVIYHFLWLKTQINKGIMICVCTPDDDEDHGRRMKIKGDKWWISSSFNYLI